MLLHSREGFEVLCLFLCLFVCPLTHFRNHLAELHQIFYAVSASDGVAMFFRFRGRHHVYLVGIDAVVFYDINSNQILFNDNKVSFHNSQFLPVFIVMQNCG